MQGCAPRRLIHRSALGYPSGRYGSQKFHRRECRLDVESLLEDLTGSAGAR
jgi:transketolase